MRVTWAPTPATLARSLESSVAADLTYAAVGSSLQMTAPAGSRVLVSQAAIGRGRAALDRLSAAVARWDLQREAGMVLATDSPVVSPGVTVVNAAPVGPLDRVALVAPCRVVAVIDEPRRRGFAYGTLPGHPLCGEERFTVELTDEDAVWLRIWSFSRLTGVAALCPPAARAGQRLINRRYLTAAARISR